MFENKKMVENGIYPLNMVNNDAICPINVLKRRKTEETVCKTGGK